MVFVSSWGAGGMLIEEERREIESGIMQAFAERKVRVGEVLQACTPIVKCPITFTVKSVFPVDVILTKVGWLDPAELLRKQAKSGRELEKSLDNFSGI